MKNIFILLILSLFTCLSFAQDRNLKLFKSPTENPTNQKRKAIVIGMSDYGAGKSLLNTLNDADDMADVLTRLGFEVTLLKNNDFRNLKTNLTNWYNTIERNDMAVFYFAGHGVEVKGENYLIPIDAELASQTDVEDYTLKVNNVLGNMDEKQVRFKLLILDACRDNPFTRGWSRGSNGKGLAGMSAPKGTLIAFAAAPGATAQDGGTYNLKNGVFTHYLKRELLKEGASIDNILNRVAGEVSKLTSDRQLPYKTGILTEDFYFIPPGNNDKPVPVPPVLSKYYYYVDQNGNESQERFTGRELAAKAMKEKNLYGKIYSNGGEVFVVEKPAPVEPDKPVVVTKRNGEIYNPDGIELVYVQEGSFTMGCTSEQGGDCDDDEKPAHRVTITTGFYMGKYEVTQAQWKAVMGNNPSYFKGNNLPVESVNWEDVQEFVRRLNAKTGRNYRLPTEAEWEYAARGGNQSARSKYSGSNTIDNVAWYTGNSGSTTHPVGQKPGNELGIYDMSGNVYEWCADWYGLYSSSQAGSYRVFRGGSWYFNAQRCRVAYRYGNSPGVRSYFLGFRVACSSK